jgi:hypothetical protein
VDPVTKFSYLTELVEMKVRKSIDGLPFTKEGLRKSEGNPREELWRHQQSSSCLCERHIGATHHN